MTDHQLEELAILQFWRALTAMRARLDERLAALRLRTREFGLLVLLARGGPHMQRELGAAIHCDRSSMVAMVDGLEAAGYVERRPHPTDRRANWVALTAAGRRALRRAVAAAAALEAELWGAGHAETRAALVAELRRLAALCGATAAPLAHTEGSGAKP